MFRAILNRVACHAEPRIRCAKDGGPGWILHYVQDKLESFTCVQDKLSRLAPALAGRVEWWARVDLNHRPPVYKSGALTN